MTLLPVLTYAILALDHVVTLQITIEKLVKYSTASYLRLIRVHGKVKRISLSKV